MLNFIVSGTRAAPSLISPACQLMLHEIKKEAISMSYICRLQPRPGALNLDKCVKCGVPPGPLLGLLKSGQDVTLQSGKLVKSTDVCEPDDPGPIFIGKIFFNFILNLIYISCSCRLSK